MSDPEDREPDYRMSLAAERTYLAYVRTGLALVAAGVAVASALPNAGAEGIRRVLGIALVVVGAAVFVFAKVRLAGVLQAIRHGRPLPQFRFDSAMTVALVAGAVASIVVVILA